MIKLARAQRWCGTRRTARRSTSTPSRPPYGRRTKWNTYDIWRKRVLNEYILHTYIER